MYTTYWHTIPSTCKSRDRGPYRLLLWDRHKQALIWCHNKEAIFTYISEQLTVSIFRAVQEPQFCPNKDNHVPINTTFTHHNTWNFSGTTNLKSCAHSPNISKWYFLLLILKQYPSHSPNDTQLRLSAPQSATLPSVSNTTKLQLKQFHVKQTSNFSGVREMRTKAKQNRIFKAKDHCSVPRTKDEGQIMKQDPQRQGSSLSSKN